MEQIFKYLFVLFKYLNLSKPLNPRLHCSWIGFPTGFRFGWALNLKFFWGGLWKFLDIQKNSSFLYQRGRWLCQKPAGFPKFSINFPGYFAPNFFLCWGFASWKVAVLKSISCSNFSVCVSFFFFSLSLLPFPWRSAQDVQFVPEFSQDKKKR